MPEAVSVEVGEPEMKLKKTCHPEKAKATSPNTKTTSDSDYRFIYIDEPITMTNSTDTYYYHTNTLYSVAAVTDSAGAVVEQYRYTAYGKLTILDTQGQEIATSAIGNTYMFTGRRSDAETGLYYFRNRYYSAELGRFVSQDPIEGWMVGSVRMTQAEMLYARRMMKELLDVSIVGIPVKFSLGMNLYAYVGNNPLMWMDPLGLFRRPSRGAWSSVRDQWASMGDALVRPLFGLSISGQTYDMSGFGQTQHDTGFYYYGTRAATYTATAAVAVASGAIVADVAAGVQTRVAVHGAHHSFGRLGNLRHIQVNAWRSGISGSGRVIFPRIPLLW